MAPCAGPADGPRRFLLVGDGGRYHPRGRRVLDSLHRIDLAVEGRKVSASPPEPVAILVPEALAFAGGDGDAAFPIDMEAIVPLPGLPDLYLVSGKRNPKIDRTRERTPSTCSGTRRTGRTGPRERRRSRPSSCCRTSPTTG